MKFAATIWIFYNFQIQKRIVSAETFCGNTVYSLFLTNNICSYVWLLNVEELNNFHEKLYVIWFSLIFLELTFIFVPVIVMVICLSFLLEKSAENSKISKTFISLSKMMCQDLRKRESFFVWSRLAGNHTFLAYILHRDHPYIT